VYRKDEIESPKSADTIRIVILGVGNILLKDEGVGIHAIRALQDSPLPKDVNLEIIDGGTSPNVLYLLDGADRLIVIDAVNGGGEPGDIYRFRPGDIEIEGQSVLSMHQYGLLEDLEMMECSGDRPKDTVIVGIEPKEIGLGLELSPEIEQKIPKIKELVLEEIREETRIC
jgi:hydrogenase maturation protease